jgi:ubiquinone/menaquinone biosynthesis C-methylase UbiE
MKRKANIRQAWNSTTREYQKRHKIPTEFAHYGPRCPNENDLRLLGSVKGKKILEIGCGGGQNSIAFAKQGAAVTGLDLSDEQIEFAKELAEKESVRVRFIRGDMQNMKEIEDDSYDIVFTAISLIWTDIGKTIPEVYRVLKGGGLFVFSDIHPFFNIFSETSLDLERSYFETGYHEWTETSKETGTETRFGNYFYTMSDYINTLIENGFHLEKVLEPEPVEGDNVFDYGESESLERLSMIPGTVIFVARKG